MRRHVRILVAAVGFVRVRLHAERVDGNDGKKLRREQESEREGGSEGGEHNTQCKIQARLRSGAVQAQSKSSNNIIVLCTNEYVRVYIYEYDIEREKGDRKGRAES
jgi:hypothetical protein